jgi:hypothetical protein
MEFKYFSYKDKYYNNLEKFCINFQILYTNN